MSKKKVSYRGIEVLDGWPEKIQEAQLISTCNPNGVEMERVRYGSEAEDWGADEGPCPDCNVVKGEFHVPGCDVERCPACGGQLMMGCDCNDACNTKKIHKPFSKRDQRIVDARRKFKWRHVGFAENGDAIFEVANQSDMRLRYLSIGIQGRGESKLIGGVWLDVSDIAPGSTGFVQRDCYKDKLLPEELEVFEKDDPVPETKDRYWEFKRLEKK
ncbi:MAG TPA: hypothetical protein VJ652_16215 [Noviherbaspirillum sp.]|nr:hypothetical protein [Noviherbaspirillum sp.]